MVITLPRYVNLSTSFRISLSNVIGAVLFKFLSNFCFLLINEKLDLGSLLTENFCLFLHFFTRTIYKTYVIQQSLSSPILSLFPFYDVPLDIVLCDRMTKSIAIENSNGERMQPCLTAVFTLNGSDGSLFTSTVHSEFRYKFNIRVDHVLWYPIMS